MFGTFKDALSIRYGTLLNVFSKKEKRKKKKEKKRQQKPASD
jgi:hypothetical protein